MFSFDPSNEKKLTDYTGLRIGAALVPLLLVFIYFGKADIGLAVFIVLGTSIVAIKMRWHLRKHIWFWAIVVAVLAFHVPLVFMVRWPRGNTPTLFYTMPFGIADFLIIYGVLGLAERFFSKDPSA